MRTKLELLTLRGHWCHRSTLFMTRSCEMSDCEVICINTRGHSQPACPFHKLALGNFSLLSRPIFPTVSLSRQLWNIVCQLLPVATFLSQNIHWMLLYFVPVYSVTSIVEVTTNVGYLQKPWLLLVSKKALLVGMYSDHVIVLVPVANIGMTLRDLSQKPNISISFSGSVLTVSVTASIL